MAIYINMMSKINYNKNSHKDNVYVEESELSFNSRVQNILLIGVDRRVSDESSRSDTMLMLSIDRVNKKIKSLHLCVIFGLIFLTVAMQSSTPLHLWRCSACNGYNRI
jgi:hypothetical protein